MNIIGTATADVLYGSDQADSIQGGDGIDTIYGGDGADTIVGEGWSAGYGWDRLYGGRGDDLYVFSDARPGIGRITELPDEGLDTVYMDYPGVSGMQLPANVENQIFASSSGYQGGREMR